MTSMSAAPVVVRFAVPGDYDWCLSIDRWADCEGVIRRKIEWSEILIAEIGGQRAGYLRLEYFWSIIPYIAMIRVREDQRRQGIGRAILAFLEGTLRARGHALLLSSSQANEPEPQAWHRHMGFIECGILAGINDDGVGEIFFRKAL
jgi:GNAT superfamily N-acetyltransferase